VTDSVWAHVVGQPQAVGQLTFAAADPVHAYLFVGPPGSTKAEASRSFAALLMAGRDDPTDRDARLALAGQHPDVREIERTGARISADQVADIIRNASLAPVEGRRKVMILHDFHFLDGPAAARLLKTLEEPPAGTVFIVLADQVTPELVTIASRCVRITFAALSDEVVATDLLSAGVDPEMAMAAAVAAGGNLTRARLLASDPGLMERRDAFAGAAHRLDGTGTAVVTLCTELLALIDAAAVPLAARQAEDLTALETRVAATGERGSGRKQVEDHHKRELRRHRADELRSGLAVLAGTYRDALVQGQLPRPEAGAIAVTRIHAALEAMERQPNELLLLQSLFLDLPSL
jgi:DNA polymerase III subunit delta'